ncbi:MAG: LLM class F420-dependent oxidoreductase [Chloroflexota bacterium]|nr:LLM class F420-dependent oxidoreductase [Chloroflexota bacterium]
MSSHPVKIGITVPPQHTPVSQLREVWLEAEEIGVDYLFMWDHFYPLSGDPNGMHFECYTLLAAAAEVTKRVKLGALVASVGYRNPNLLADMARTIDHISNGRFIFGIGSGWKVEDYDEYGYDFKTAPDRLRDLKAAMPVIKERLAVLNPPPVQEHMPILIGGGGEKVTLRIVAEHADIWNGFGNPEEIARKSAILDEHCAAIGRDPSEIERSVLANGDDVVANADGYVAKGITTIITGNNNPGPGMQKIRDLVAWRDSR